VFLRFLDPYHRKTGLLLLGLVMTNSFISGSNIQASLPMDQNATKVILIHPRPVKSKNVLMQIEFPQA